MFEGWLRGFVLWGGNIKYFREERFSNRKSEGRQLLLIKLGSFEFTGSDPPRPEKRSDRTLRTPLGRMLIKINLNKLEVRMIKQLNKSVLNVSQMQYSQLAQMKREKQAKLVKHIKQALSPTFLSVQDTTLGVNSCGTMYKIIIESPMFAQKTKVEQHKLVAEAIRTEMPFIHGYNLKTRPPAELSEQTQAKKIEEEG